jgi:LuxR family transcriptional regulator, maltose regulon positive regulatory protein
MGRPLLETKFHAPPAVGRLVARPRLTERLRQGTATTLTLVSAPAGFGKSTLIAQLASLQHDNATVAWLSVDPGDNDPAAFWSYVVGALERASPGVTGNAQSGLEGGDGSVDGAIAALINGLAAQDAELVMVLDDLHAVDSPVTHQQLAWFLDHLPANIHVVIGTRADPPMPLARLRARGALTEIRAAELRFTAEEAAEYLNAVMGLGLTAHDIAALEARTEGWIAALQLAALSIRGRDEPSEFIAAFSGDDRYVVDYLVEEVLRRQPPSTRDFLLRTSILARLTGPLADAVTGRADGRATLEALDRANLFLIPLDDQRRWYRYHHLFGGVLQAHLATELPNEIPDLHHRAGEWFEQQGDFDEAIRHAFEARDFERAADLLELAAPPMGRLRREPEMCRLIGRVPRDVLDRRPVLLVEYAGALLSIHEFDHVKRLLDTAELALTGESAGNESVEPVFVDRAAFAHLPAALTLYRAALAKLDGDAEAHLGYARRVLEVAAADDHLSRGGAQAFLGLAHWEAGDLEPAYRWYADGMASLEKAGRIADLVGGAITTADIRLAQGRLTDALALYEQGLDVGTRGGKPFLRGVSDMYTGIGEVRYRRNDLAGAAAALEHSLRLGDDLGFPRHPYLVRLLQARLLQAQGDIEGALRAFDEAEPRYVADFSPNVRPIPAQRAAVLIAHRRLAEARKWASNAHVALDEPATYIREYELLTFARLLVAEARAGANDVELEHTQLLVDRLLAAAEAGRRNGSVLEILIVRALAGHAAGDEERALSSLDRALALAEPDQHTRVFIDQGPVMTPLLRLAAKRSPTQPFATELLNAARPDRDRPSTAQGLVEPLSERELDVLRLLRSELSGPEMANELVVSLNTLRTHTKNVYAKLGVTSRMAALRRAEELGLL